MHTGKEKITNFTGKVAAIPLVGRYLLKAFNEELGERQLKESSEEEAR